MTAKAVVARLSEKEKHEKPLDLGLLWRIMANLGPYKWLILCGNLLCFLAVGAEMLMIRAVGRLIDRLQGETLSLLTGGAAETAGMLLLGLVAPLAFFCLVNRYCGSAQWLVTVYATNRALLDLRTRFFVKLQSLSKSFFDQHQAGWLVARNTGDMQVIWSFMTYSLMMLVVFVTTVGGSMLAIAAITPVLLLPMALFAPIFLVVVYVYKRRMSKAQRETREQNSRLVATMAETVRGIRVVHAFNREERNLARFNEINGRSRDLEMRVARLNGLFLPSLDFVGILNMTVVVLFSAYLIRQGYQTLDGQRLTTGDVVQYIGYMNAILFPLRMVMEIYSLALTAGAAAERVFEIIDIEPAIQDKPGAPAAGRLTGRIVLDGVDYRYGPEEPWVLKDFDLTIEPGQTVAIVGETGAGKTTVASLVARFYDVDAGAVRIDGLDVREVTQASLHRQMGIVLQEGYLFTGTVLENIRFGRPELTEAEVEDLARALGTHEALANLPDGYATLALEGGENLSRGQRQLVSLTRAVAADPRILIFDEPTSALDVYTERVVQRALDVMTAERTTIVIAHRLSTVRNADRILVMDGGRILEDGSHAELIAKRGRYYELVERSLDHEDGASFYDLDS